jgi:hypothetical protein
MWPHRESSVVRSIVALVDIWRIAWLRRAPEFGYVGFKDRFKCRCRATYNGYGYRASAIFFGHVRKALLTSVDLNVTPIERVGHVVPDVSFISKEEHIIEAHTTSYNIVSYRQEPEVGVDTYPRRLQDRH